MNVLQQLRAAAPLQAPYHPADVSQASHGDQRASGPPAAACPFAFGPWLPRSDAAAHPGEAQRSIHRGDQLLGWWRREWITPTPLPDEAPADLQPFPCHAVYSADGTLLVASTDQQAMLEHLAHGI